MLRLGLDSYSYHFHLKDQEPREAVRWFLDKLLDFGLDGCQFDPSHLDGWDETLVREIAKSCAEHGLYLELGTGGFDYERLAHRLEMAAAVGARVVRTFISGERCKIPAGQLEAWIGIAKTNFKRLAEVAERVAVPLALENHEDLTSSEVVEIMEAAGSPYIRACVDTGNSLPVREDPVECVRNLVPYAAATHLKDWRYWWEGETPKREGSALGQGDAKIARVYPILREAHPDMPITLELAPVRRDGTFQSPEQVDEMLIESIEYLRGLEARLPDDVVG